MTASSIDLFPCQVPLMGLQNRSGDIAIGVQQPPAPPPPPPRPPTAAAVRRISRNLFGAPQPGEMDEKLREEQQRQRNYVLQRYNFDIEKSQTWTTAHGNAPVENIPPIGGEIINAPMPELIMLEMQEHEQRLLGDTCNLSRTNKIDEFVVKQNGGCIKKHHKTTPIKRIAVDHNNHHHLHHQHPHHHHHQNHHHQRATNNNCKISTLEQNSAAAATTPVNERLKPYAKKQTLLTDCFNLRKSTAHSGKTQLTATNNQILTQQRHLVEVIQLPQPLRAVDDAHTSTLSSSSATSDNLEISLSTKTVAVAAITATTATTAKNNSNNKNEQ